MYYTLETKKTANICDSGRNMKTECNLQHFTRNAQIENLDDFERMRLTCIFGEQDF